MTFEFNNIIEIMIDKPTENYNFFHNFGENLF